MYTHWNAVPLNALCSPATDGTAIREMDPSGATGRGKAQTASPAKAIARTATGVAWDPGDESGSADTSAREASP